MPKPLPLAQQNYSVFPNMQHKGDSDFGASKLGIVRQESFKRSRSFTDVSPTITPMHLSTCTTPEGITNCAPSSTATIIERPTAPSPAIQEKMKMIVHDCQHQEQPERGLKRNHENGGQFLKSPLEEQCEVAGRIVTYLTNQFHGHLEPTKVFSGVKPASIPFLKYTQRLMVFTNKYAEEKDGPRSIGVQCAVLAVEYLERADIKLTPESLHRCFLSAYLVGIKILYDFYFSNAFWGEVGGLTLKETNAMEIGFCEALKWSFFGGGRAARNAVVEFC